MSIVGYIFLLLGLGAPEPIPEQDRLAFIEYAAPGYAEVTGEYRCGAERVRLVVSSSPGSVRVQLFEAGSRLTADHELQRWNAALSALGELDHVTFKCQTGGHQLITIFGAVTPLLPQKKSIVARWNQDGLSVVDVFEF